MLDALVARHPVAFVLLERLQSVIARRNVSRYFSWNKVLPGARIAGPSHEEGCLYPYQGSFPFGHGISVSQNV